MAIMKYMTSQMVYLFRKEGNKRNFVLLGRFFAVLFALVTAYSILFHYIMMHEGREFSWITGFYWTLTVMSTLGFGDITFHSDLGRSFSMLVLMSGIVFLLILLPFTFIQFFYAPWIEAQSGQTANVQRLLLFRLAISGRLFERKNDDFFTRVGTDIVVQAANLDFSDIANQCLQSWTSRFDQLGPNLFQQVSPFLCGERCHQMLLGRGQDALQSNH